MFGWSMELPGVCRMRKVFYNEEKESDGAGWTKWNVMGYGTMDGRVIVMEGSVYKQWKQFPPPIP